MSIEDAKPTDTPEAGYTNISGSQRLYEFVVASPRHWHDFPGEFRLEAAHFAWDLYESVDFALPSDDIDVLPVLRLAWADTACCAWMQSQMSYWSKDRREAFAALMQEAKPTYEALPEPLTGDAWQETPEPREWLVDGWLPNGEISLLTGPGSVGKSLLMLQLGAALACDRKVLNGNRGWLPSNSPMAVAPQLTPEPVPVVLAGWEDGKHEALRRRYRLNAFGGCSWAKDKSINEYLHVLPMRGFGATWAPINHGHIATVGGLTDTGRALRAYCEKHGAKLLVLDTLAHALLTKPCGGATGCLRWLFMGETVAHW